MVMPSSSPTQCEAQEGLLQNGLDHGPDPFQGTLSRTHEPIIGLLGQKFIAGGPIPIS